MHEKEVAYEASTSEQAQPPSCNTMQLDFSIRQYVYYSSITLSFTRVTEWQTLVRGTLQVRLGRLSVCLSMAETHNDT